VILTSINDHIPSEVGINAPTSTKQLKIQTYINLQINLNRLTWHSA